MASEWRVGCLVVVIHLLAPVNLRADDWPQWRGPNGQGVTTASNLPPNAESTSLKIRWKTAIPGEGCSSPIVHHGRVYLTTAYAGEEPHPWDRAASITIIACAAGAIGLTLLRGRTALRAFRNGTHWRNGFTAWIVLASVLTVGILAKPKWFWQFADPWSGTVVTAAEFPLVETLYLRPLVLLFIGALVVVFARMALKEARPSPPATGLTRLMAFVTVSCTIASALAAGLMGWRPDWFWQPGQPWLAWIAAGGIALFAFATSIGWLAEGSWLRSLAVSIGLALAAWLFVNTPNDQFATDLDWRIRLAYVMPSIVLLNCHAILFALARVKCWPRSAASSYLIPSLLCVLGAALFVRSNELHAQTGIVRAVVCLDAKSGTLLWQTPVYVGPAEKAHAFNSHATPTPATDGDAIYAYFGSGLAALSLDGQIRWLNRDHDYAKFSRYGSGSSVVLADDLIIVYRDSEYMGHGHHLDDEVAHQDRRRPSALIAYDKKTGVERWNVMPAFSHDSYMTPLVWTRDGETEIVIATWKTLAGIAAKNGALRWKHAYPMQQIVPSLAVHGDCLFVTGGNDLPSPIFAIRAPTGHKPSETVWASRKGGGTMVSPVCWDGLLFAVSHLGVLSCRSADTGDVHWSKRLGARYLGSIVAGDGKLFAVDHEGTLFVVSADRQGAVLAEFPLFEPCAATPALADRCIFVRTSRHVICVEGRK